jgi:serine incorporator 1/3
MAIAGSPVCCGGKNFCNACCAGCDKLGIPAKNFPRVTYVIQALIFMITSVLMMIILGPLAEKYSWGNCELLSDSVDACFGQATVLRASFSLASFHFIMLIFLCPRAQCSSAIHDGFWPVKILLLIGIFISSFFIPYEFFVFWGYICRAGSVIFLLIQAYFLLNLAYTWGDNLTAATQDRDGSAYA